MSRGNGVVENGDTATISFLGKLNGVAFNGGYSKGHNLKIGSGQFIPGFEPQLIGLEKGSCKVITVTFPADYQAPNLAGQETTFDVCILDIL